MSDLEYDSGLEDFEGGEDELFTHSQNQSQGEAEGNDDGFVFTDASKREERKPGQVDYAALEVKDLQEKQEKLGAQVQTVLGVPAPVALALLRQYGWKQDKLLDDYMEDQAATLAKAGMSSDPGDEGMKIKKKFTCEVCYMTEKNLKTYSLPCGHRYCADCYEHYLTNKIMEEGTPKIECMTPKCGLSFDESTISKLVKPEVMERYERVLLQHYIDNHQYLKWCPFPECKYAVECHVSKDSLNRIVPSVQCKGGHPFCFGCSLENHQPATCSIVKLWIKKCKDDSETANWIAANTKECPKCSSTIEKNGGCNHMKCKKCGFDFCWICLTSWADHGTSWYNCGRYQEKEAQEALNQQAKSRASLERYLHYFTRYDNHHQSAKLERELYQKIEKKMEQMQSTSELSWIEVQFLKNATDVLFSCRMILKWTYAFAFYLQRDNHTVIFEDNQRDLEMAVEHLSELVESPIEATSISSLKQKVLDKMVYVSSRTKILLEDCAHGLLEERWKYALDVSPI